MPHVLTMADRPPPLGSLLQRVMADSRASARVDAAGSSEWLRFGHAQALTLLLRDAVLTRDWPRAAGVSE